jgi:hypothetical protein
VEDIIFCTHISITKKYDLKMKSTADHRRAYYLSKIRVYLDITIKFGKPKNYVEPPPHGAVPMNGCNDCG